MLNLHSIPKETQIFPEECKNTMMALYYTLSARHNTFKYDITTNRLWLWETEGYAIPRWTTIVSPELDNYWLRQWNNRIAETFPTFEQTPFNLTYGPPD